MTFIILSILIPMIFIIGYFIASFVMKEIANDRIRYASPDAKMKEKIDAAGASQIKTLRTWLLIAFPVALLILIFVSSFTAVPTGHIGVVRTFGKVDTATLLPEGAHFVLPWQTVFTLDNRTTKTSLEKPAEAASHDMQSVHTNIAVNWRVDPAKVGTVLQQFGLNGDGGDEMLVSKVVIPSILETFKSVMSQYTAEELVTKRIEVSNRVTDYLTKKLAQYDLIVETTNLTDFQFSPQFNAAIEAKVTATQQALQAEQILKRVKVEAEQRIAQAEGEARAIQIQAQAIKSQGGAEYVQLQAIHKWNGTLPTMMMSEKSVPFISVAKKE